MSWSNSCIPAAPLPSALFVSLLTAGGAMKKIAQRDLVQHKETLPIFTFSLLCADVVTSFLEL